MWTLTKNNTFSVARLMALKYLSRDLVFRTGCGIRLCRFLIIAFLSTLYHRVTKEAKKLGIHQEKFHLNLTSVVGYYEGEIEELILNPLRQCIAVISRICCNIETFLGFMSDDVRLSVDVQGLPILYMQIIFSGPLGSVSSCLFDLNMLYCFSRC